MFDVKNLYLIQNEIELFLKEFEYYKYKNNFMFINYKSN